MNTEAEEENAFLTKELEDSLDLYNSFIDDIEKVNKVLNGINSKKESIKNEIVDYRLYISVNNNQLTNTLQLKETIHIYMKSKCY